jgi:hypothetical protein
VVESTSGCCFCLQKTTFLQCQHKSNDHPRKERQSYKIDAFENVEARGKELGFMHPLSENFAAAMIG